MNTRQAHPARTVVLLPFAQLMPLAARLWAREHALGFAPRFETTQNWCQSLRAFSPGPSDISFDPALDMLCAQAILDRAGLGGRADVATPVLHEAVRLLGHRLAAVPPAQRSAWAARAGSAVHASLDTSVLALEAAVSQLALAWAAQSAYASDVLFEPHVIESVDCLIAVQGFLPDPLLASLPSVWGDRMCVLEMAPLSPALHAEPAWHAARDAQDEAQRAAACVMQHVRAGRTPVALAATDRVLTRRVRAMLETQAVQLRDETGWKLSTSRAAAHVMGALRASAWNASSDLVLDWLKNAPAFEATRVQDLEARVRRHARRSWHEVPAVLAGLEVPALASLLEEINALRAGLQRARTLAHWLDALREVLERAGQWPLLQEDVAGEAVLATLRLPYGGAALPADALWAGRRLTLSEFTHWVDQSLESASFKPAYPLQEQVVILPMAQMLGRNFAALVLPGCDEVRLNPSPEPTGLWTAGQREVLGLPGRELLDTALRAAWVHALDGPRVDVLWRCHDEGGEPLMPSLLVQQVRLNAGGAQAEDPRELRQVRPAPVPRPMPSAPGLAVTRLSASAYQDLRHCPYRFFALRQLGLKEAEELELELDKRDFGLWLHAVLKTFHDHLKAARSPDDAARRTLMDAAVAEVTQSMRLAEDEFLPFQAAWPRVREGYLEWLRKHEAQGLRFAQGERDASQALGTLTLVGRLDRIDQSDAGEVMVIDYKTEAQGVTRDRIRQPLEDTQLAFYAALLPHDTLRAAYVSVGEKDGTKDFEQHDVVAVRDALLAGIADDLQRIQAGAAMPALGEGQACEFCAARGLCRRDFWNDGSHKQ